MSSRGAFARVTAGLTGNLLILLLLAFAGGLATWAPEHYYQAVQEDSYVEWASFWAFALAAGAFTMMARRPSGAARGLPWFALGVGAFCVVVALEEISWGQRLVGYRPPTFFLEHNYQQEFNLHNVVASRLRELGVELVILAYGIVLPLAMHVRVIGPRLERWGISAPPEALVPAFATMLVIYLWYPWDFAGEWVELALGLGLLFAASINARPDEERRSGRAARPGLRLAVAALAATGLGVMTTAVQDARATSDPRRVTAAQIELDALATDLKPLLAASQCGVHKRLYTLVRGRGWDTLRAGRFAALGADAVPKARIAYLLDPWNSPYWVRERCAEAADGERIALLYSLGPNRGRDSTEQEIVADDVGVRLLLDDRDP